MSDLICNLRRSTVYYLLLAGIVFILIAWPVCGLGIEGMEKNTSSQEKAGVLAQSAKDAVVQGKIWQPDENYDFSQEERVTIIGTKPEAEFTYRVNEKKVIFVDTSTGNPSSWFWTFGDGTSSPERSPTHFYTSHGTYTVTLTVSNTAGTTSKTQTLYLNQPPRADFQYSVNGNTVIFTDTSAGGPTGWLWTFGDGLSSTQQHPVHTYTRPGSYTVTVMVSNNAAGSSKTKIVNLNQPPVADFTYEINGNTVTFTDASAGGPTEWLWTFGDGSSTDQRNPVHTYGSGGTYTATLTVSGGQTGSAKSKSFTLADLPEAGFEYSERNLIVTFSDTSRGGVTHWSWNFGDGTVSVARNPYHIYQSPGIYLVDLTVTNRGGSSTISREVVVTGTVTSESPDLIMGELSGVPTYLSPGEKVLVQAETINRGSSSASSFFNYYYLSPDDTYSPDDTWVGSQFVSSLPAGGSFTQTVTLSIPPRIPEGSYYIIAIADATEMVPEYDENNVKPTAVPSILTGRREYDKDIIFTPTTWESQKMEYLQKLFTR